MSVRKKAVTDNSPSAECYGWSSPDVEAELLSLIAQIFENVGLQKTRLEINSLGDSETRAAYREALVAYLQNHRDSLDEDSERRLSSNPLRILDSKNKSVQAILESAPSILDYLNEDSANHFKLLQVYLDDLGIEYTINPKLVRGLDYYNDTVFEWINADFGAQSTVCAGGRYDGLVSQLGGAQTPGFGFGMGLERLIQILEEQSAPITKLDTSPQIFLVSSGENARRQALVIQTKLTGAGIKVQLHCGQGSIKNQFKRADKSGAAIALIIGEDEATAKTVSIKALRRGQSSNNQQAEQQTIVQNDVLNAVTNLLESL